MILTKSKLYITDIFERENVTNFEREKVWALYGKKYILNPPENLSSESLIYYYMGVLSKSRYHNTTKNVLEMTKAKIMLDIHTGYEENKEILIFAIQNKKIEFLDRVFHCYSYPDTCLILYMLNNNLYSVVHYYEIIHGENGFAMDPIRYRKNILKVAADNKHMPFAKYMLKYCGEEPGCCINILENITNMKQFISFFRKHYEKFLELAVITCDIISNTSFPIDIKIELLSNVLYNARYVDYVVANISTKDKEVIFYLLNFIEAQNLDIDWETFLKNIKPEIIGKLILKCKKQLHELF